MRLSSSAVALLFFLFAFTPAYGQTVEDLQKSIAASRDHSDQARLYGQLGDAWVAQDNLDQGAAAYLNALAADRDSFSPAERLRMAIQISWADRLAESEAELRHLLALDSKNTGARTHLARVLSWSGDLQEAIEETEAVLRDAPGHKEALLVRADALQWQGRYLDALPIYRSVIGRDGDFDAQVGLARSLLGIGDRLGAMKNLSALKPLNAREKREVARLEEAVLRGTRPALEARYNYYSDSDRNRLDRYGLAGNSWIGNQKYGLDYRHTEARDRTRRNRAEDFLLTLDSRITDRISAGAGLGFTQLADRHTSTFPAGHLRLDARLFRGSAGVTVARESLTDTAELIDNRIRATHVGLSITQPLTDRFSVHAGYRYRSFSDGNHANEIQLVSQYALALAPRITIGHRFRLLDFHTQSGNGYFDPNDYLANRAFSSLYYENRFFYTYLEGYLGYQTFRRNGVAGDDFIHGGSGSVGVKPFPGLAIEVNAEGGNFAAGATSGFNYFIIGPRVIYKF